MTIRQWKVFRAVVEQGRRDRRGPVAVYEPAGRFARRCGNGTTARLSSAGQNRSAPGVNGRGMRLYHKIVPILEAIDDLEQSAAADRTSGAAENWLKHYDREHVVRLPWSANLSAAIRKHRYRYRSGKLRNRPESAGQRGGSGIHRGRFGG